MVLDGGLATELEARGFDLEDPLWSARVLLEDPAAIQLLHGDYLAAGADCITSASYQATLEGLGREGFSRRRGEALLARSVDLAIAARDAFWGEPANRAGRLRPLVAASVGPYGAFLANGAEYTGDYDLDVAGLVAFHRRRLEVLAASGADLLACETIPSCLEARALCQLLDETQGPPAWLSFSCRDARRLSDGSDLGAVVAELEGCDRVIAIGVNCTAPGFLPGLIDRLAAASAKPIVVYPNSGEGYDAVGKTWSGAGGLDVSAVGDWLRRGARLIGGCCRVGPGEIQALRRCLLDDAAFERSPRRSARSLL